MVSGFRTSFNPIPLRARVLYLIPFKVNLKSLNSYSNKKRSPLKWSDRFTFIFPQEASMEGLEPPTLRTGT